MWQHVPLRGVEGFAVKGELRGILSEEEEHHDTFQSLLEEA
jgi:hypothetical protein